MSTFGNAKRGEILRVSSMLLTSKRVGPARGTTSTATHDAWLSWRSSDAKVYPDKLEGPGGKWEKSETAITCAIRELQEETCLYISDPARYLDCGSIVCRRRPDFHVRVNLFLVELEPDECPNNGEPKKRGPWRRYPIDPTSAYQRFMTIATETLYRIALINLGLEG